MPRPKKPAAPAPPVVQASKTAHLFAARRPNERGAITHERLAADLEAFHEAGGRIEVLGVTRALKKIGPDALAEAEAAARPAPVKRGR